MLALCLASSIYSVLLVEVFTAHISIVTKSNSDENLGRHNNLFGECIGFCNFKTFITIALQAAYSAT